MRAASLLLPLLLGACALRAPPDTPATHRELARAKDPVQLASYDLVWTTLRDVYPDPAMKGLDWASVYREGLPAALVAQSAGELRPTLTAMLARLGDSHCQIFPGAARGAPGMSGWRGQDSPSVDELAGVGLLTGIPTRVEHGVLADGVHLITLTAFMPPALQPLADAVAAARAADARGVVLDLRGNPGGLALQAGAVAGMFMPPGSPPIARVVSRESELIIPLTPRPKDRRYEGPLAVLTDGGTASTAEFFVAAVKATGRGRVFGQPTAGEALMATTRALPNGDALYHPIAFVYDPTGAMIEGAGVQPDVLVPPAPEGEGDPTLEAARCWITGGC